MANPTVQALPADTWVAVAVNTTSASVYILDSRPLYYIHTYRDNAQAAPANNDTSQGVRIDKLEGFGFKVGADLYIMAVGKSGSVRVDN